MSGTSLAEQLKKLAVPQTSTLVHSKKKPSLLFDPKDAADINRETFYKIGLSGLEELKAIDPRLAEFEKSLFDETSQHLVRAVEDQVANAKLDQLINRFLILLSPYFNLKASHKALEWLICRFHVHEYNIDSIVALILPYHDTNIFARMVQVLSFQDKGTRWLWLQPLKKEGIPMSKLFLLSRASSDTSFFKFICNLPLQGVQVHGEKSVCLTTLFAFYCTTVIGAIEQTPQVSEVQVSHLLPSLIAGINSSHLDFTASAFMILGHLVSKIRLTPGIYSELFYKVCRSEQPCLRNEAALVLVVMAQSGRSASILPSVHHLATTSWFLPTLSKLASSGVVIFPLVADIVSDCLSAMKNADITQQELLQNFLSKLLEHSAFNNDEAGKLFKLFAEIPLSKSKWYQDVLHQLEKSYPETFDEAVKIHPQLLKLIPAFNVRNDLFQRLNHPESRIRLEAIRHIKSDIILLKEKWVCENLINHLTDESTKVVAAVLGLAGSLPKKQLSNQLIILAGRSWHAQNNFHNLGPLVLSQLRGLKNIDSSLLLLLILPFLLPSCEKSLKTAKAVLNCAAVKKCVILKPLCEKLEEKMTETTFSEEVYKFIENGLKSLNVDSIFKAGKQLESHGLVYQLMTLLVATGALPDGASPATLGSLLQLLNEYNSSSSISSEIQEKLSKENIGPIVAVCRHGKLPFQGSLHALSVVMKHIRNPLPDGKYICDVKDQYTTLIVNMYQLVLQMTKWRNTHIRKAYSNFCKEMFQICCLNTEGQIDFLSNIVLGRPDIAAECVSQVQQLVEELTTIKEQVLVPAMLVALQSEDDCLRHNALALLNSLTQKLALPTYHKLLDQLTEHGHEIAVDNEQVNVVLYLCLSPDPSVQSLLKKPVRQDMTNILNSLIDIVVAPDTPFYCRSSLLRILDQVNSQSLLLKLLPLAMKVLESKQQSEEELNVLKAIIRRINASTASAFSDSQVWLFVEACLKDHKAQVVDGIVPAVLLLNQIDRELVAAINTTHQERLLNLIISCVAETEQNDVTSAASTCFKRISLDAAVVVALLEPMKVATLETSQNIKKRAWTVKKPPSLELLTSNTWKRGLCLLEFIQNKKKLENVKVLLPTLFGILERCLQFEEQSPVEYTKQVLLTSLLHCCVKLSPDSSPVDLPESSIQVELVVECVRVSSNPQTHHHALLLLAHIANMIPVRVLHSIMSIFTFMGSSILRQDDAYSFQIISKIVETIVPVLIKTEAEEQELTSDVVTVLRVFAGAMLDIPEHRRIPLLTKLLTTLSQGNFLWTFLSLVFESHILHPSPDNTTVKESGSIPKRLEVGLQLCHQFSPAIVLNAACRLMHYLCTLPVDKDDLRVQTFKKSRLGSLFDVERATDKQLRHYTYTGLTFLSFLLSSKQFFGPVATLTSEEIQALRDTFQQMFEGILTFTQSVSKQVDITAGQITAKYWKSMFSISFDVLAKTNALLPGDMFLHLIVSLLDHKLLSLRIKALELLNLRLQQALPMDSTQLLALLPPLLSLINKCDSSQLENQVMLQTALLSIKLLARHLGAEHPSEFQKVFNAVIKLIKKKTILDPLLSSAVLCVGELSHTLGAHAIINLPHFMPTILAVLENHVLGGSGDLLLMSMVSAVHKIMDSLASFLSPYMNQLLQRMCILSSGCAQHTENTKLQPVIQKLKTIRQKISNDVPLRVLLPAVTDSYHELVAGSHTDAIPSLLSVLGESFKTGQQLTPELITFFLSALDFRSQVSSEAEVELVESAVISAIIALVFKLSESSFRPFYYKIFNWAFQDDVHKDRSITFYKLTYSLAENLKGLFVSFANYFLKNAASLLDENNKAKQQIDWSTRKAVELVEAILSTLYTVFLHDASHFVNKERFDTLMQSIVDQLENDLGGDGEMELRTTKHTIPCLTQMAASVADDTLWKQLNYQILLKTRHDTPQVRIGGVLAVCEIAKKLGEEFLPLLPETVPFLAELLEDEVESVEKTSQRVVQELEAALGEPISKYF